MPEAKKINLRRNNILLISDILNIIVAKINISALKEIFFRRR